MKKIIRRINPHELSTPYLLFQAWRDAAAEWRRLRSDCAEARCRAALDAYYRMVWGYVPPIGEIYDPGSKIAR